MIDGNSPWRSLGDLTAEQFLSLIPDDSPMKPDAALIQHAASGMTALYAAQAAHESQWGTTGIAKNHPDWHNAQGSTIPGSDHVYQQFPTWDAGALWWKQHVTTYAPYQATTTIAEYVHVYAPASDGNDEAAYVAAIVKVSNMVTTPTPTQTTPAPLGHIPKPPVRLSHVTGAIGVNREPDAPRQNTQVGTVTHTSDGTYLGNRSVFINQQMTWGGLTDYQVGGGGDGQYDGVIDEFIDPAAEIVPYANGTWRAGPDTPTQQAINFVNTYGINAINQRLRSIEHPDNGQNDYPISPRQFDSSAFLVAWIHGEQDGQTAETFAWFFGHDDFGVQHSDCPGIRFRNVWDTYTARVKEIMAAYQEGKPLSSPLIITYPPDWAGGVIPQPTSSPTQTYAPRHPLPAKTFASNGKVYFYVPGGFTMKSIAAFTPREYAGTASAATGPEVPIGQACNFSHIVADDSGNSWFVGTGGSRCPASAFIEGAS